LPETEDVSGGQKTLNEAPHVIQNKENNTCRKRWDEIRHEKVLNKILPSELTMLCTPTAMWRYHSATDSAMCFGVHPKRWLTFSPVAL
jgi:hypothetical protein